MVLMRLLARHLVLAVPLLAVLSACTTVPVTGRQQLDIVPESTLAALSLEQYQEFLQSHQVIHDTPEAATVEQVGQRLQGAVERFLTQEGYPAGSGDYRWEFHLIDRPEANAWALPGGKVAVYRGILPVARDEAGLAVVMGHEIAHVIANHGGERMSQALLTQMGGKALSAALQSQPDATRQLWTQVFGLGSQVGYLLPYSRLQEREADRLGLIFMAMAGYNPRAALAFWERMLAQSDQPQPPELLSSHPAGRERLNQIQQLIPEAQRYYQSP